MRPNLVVWSTAVLALTSLALAQDIASEIPQFEASRVQAANDPRPTILSPGLLVSIYGSHLGPTNSCQGRPDPELRETPHPDVPFPNLGVYPKELCGVQVLVDGQPAGLLYVHADQINFKVPMTVPVEGTIGLQVTHGVRASELVEIPAGRQTIRISIPESVFTNMPIWIEIQTPLNWHTDIRYPMGDVPPKYQPRGTGRTRLANSLGVR